MFNKMKNVAKLCSLLCLFMAHPFVAHAEQALPPVDEILKQADAYRLTSGSSKINTRVRLYKVGREGAEDKMLKERLYEVLIKPGRRSLVVFLSAAEAGQKVLMLDDRYWLLMPKTRRPLRITASQKLLGEASTGDIATMTWSEDYRGEVVGELELEGVPALKLLLQAQVKGASYHRIEAIVKRDGFQPLQADLYMKSGKLVKQAIFKLGLQNGEERIVRTVLKDRINKNKMTVIDYLSLEAAVLPDKIFNPAYLQRNPEL